MEERQSCPCRDSSLLSALIEQSFQANFNTTILPCTFSIARRSDHLHMDCTRAGLRVIGLFLGVCHYLPRGRHSGRVLGAKEAGLRYHDGLLTPHDPQPAGCEVALFGADGVAICYRIGFGE